MSSVKVKNSNQYNTAKLWQISLFTLNNTSTNLHLFVLGFVTFYATGIAGLAVMVVSSLLMAARLIDGVIDPAMAILLIKQRGNLVSLHR